MQIEPIEHKVNITTPAYVSTKRVQRAVYALGHKEIIAKTEAM